MITLKNIFGIGPALALAGALSAALIALCDLRWGARICLPVNVYRHTLAAGIILATLGVILWTKAVCLVIKGNRERALITTGVFQNTRNPMYAAFILLLIPGAALILNNLFFMLVSIVMFLTFKRLIIREESCLLKQYGDLYIRYLNNVSQLIPRARLW